MKPIHEKAMPVILTNIDEQKLWLTEGDEALLRPYEGEMEFDQFLDTLEHLTPKRSERIDSSAGLNRDKFVGWVISCYIFATSSKLRYIKPSEGF